MHLRGIPESKKSVQAYSPPCPPLTSYTRLLRLSDHIKKGSLLLINLKYTVVRIERIPTYYLRGLRDDVIALLINDFQRINVLGSSTSVRFAFDT